MTLTDEQKLHRREWAAALRSGEYRQTGGKLKDDDNGALCCLGVACDLFAKNGLGFWKNALFFTCTEPSFHGKSGSPPQEVNDYFGISFPRRYESANDSARLTFPQIADLIDKDKF